MSFEHFWTKDITECCRMKCQPVNNTWADKSYWHESGVITGYSQKYKLLVFTAFSQILLRHFGFTHTETKHIPPKRPKLHFSKEVSPAAITDRLKLYQQRMKATDSRLMIYHMHDLVFQFWIVTQLTWWFVFPFHYIIVPLVLFCDTLICANIKDTLWMESQWSRRVTSSSGRRLAAEILLFQGSWVHERRWGYMLRFGVNLQRKHEK